jgi:hypothetical protein
MGEERELNKAVAVMNGRKYGNLFNVKERKEGSGRQFPPPLVLFAICTSTLSKLCRSVYSGM